MSNIYFNEIKGKYALPVKAEWAQNLYLKTAHIYHDSRADLHILESYITLISNQQATQVQKTKRNALFKLYGAVTFLLFSMLYIFGIVRFGETGKPAIILKSVIGILTTLTIYYLVTAHIFEALGKPSKIIHPDTLKLHDQIKNNFETENQNQRAI